VKKLKNWQMWGFVAAGLCLALDMILLAIGNVWLYQETGWYTFLIFMSYPASVLHRAFLHGVGIPRIYDVPMTWSETLIANISGVILGCSWWFLLGVVGSIIWQWLVKRLRGRK
jgi:hypothetical protein